MPATTISTVAQLADERAQTKRSVSASERTSINPFDHDFVWGANHTKGALWILAGLVLAVCIQISLLSGWHLGGGIEALKFTAAGQTTVEKDGKVRFELKGPPAVVNATASNLPSSEIAAITLNFDYIPEGASLTTGWLSTRDTRRPASLTIPLQTSQAPVELTVMLRGHPQWRDTITRFAVALQTQGSASDVVMQPTTLVQATPWSSAALAWLHWFKPRTVLTTQNHAQRVLPISLWFALAGVFGLLALAARSRTQTTVRSEAIVGGGFALAALAFFCAVYAPFALTLTAPSLGWISAAAAIIATQAPWLKVDERGNEDFSTTIAISLTFALVAIALAGWGLTWSLLIIAILLVGRIKPLWLKRLAPFAFFLPAVIAGAAMQRYLSLPSLLGELRDPSGSVASLLARGSAMPGLIVVAFVAHRFWPSAQNAVRSSLPAGLASWYALILTVLTLATPAFSRAALTDVGAAWVVLPVLAAVGLFVWPAFQTRATAAVANIEQQKTEHDLSAVVRSLFDGASESFNQAIRSQEWGRALAPLKRMQEIAPASLITRTAELRYSVFTKKPEMGAVAYAALTAVPVASLPAESAAAIVSYASRTKDFATVVRYGLTLPKIEPNLRVVAHGQLMAESDSNASELEVVPTDPHAEPFGIDAAINTLAAFDPPTTFAREIAELHLLKDDWQTAQRAMIHTGVDLQSAMGKAYVTRLGLRAAGARSYEKEITDAATWSASVGAAQAAMGEMLLKQGNEAGARARFILAEKIDVALWPLQWRIRELSRKLGASINAEIDNNADSDSSAKK
jgi:hypothetical protein